MNLSGMFVEACKLQVVQILKLNSVIWGRLWVSRESGRGWSGVTRQHFTGAAVGSHRVCVCGSQSFNMNGWRRKRTRWRRSI